VRVYVDENGGGGGGNGDDCRIDDFYASPFTVDDGDTTRLYWRATGDCDRMRITGGGMSEDYLDEDDDIKTERIYNDTTFTLRAYNSDNHLEDTDTVRVYVRDDNNQYVSATTIGALNITPSSATLSGSASLSGGGSMTTYFEYGSSIALGLTTNPLYFSSGTTPVVQNISSLSSNTTYYFRVVVVGNSAGATYGQTKSFTTSGFIVPTPTPTNTVTTVVVSGTADTLLTLDMETDFETNSCDETNYIRAKYTNTSGSRTATDTILHVIFPENLKFVRASQGEYSKKDHELTVLLGSVSPRETEVITIETKTSSDSSEGELLVTAGTLTYEKSGLNEQVIALITNRAGDCPGILGAFALGAGVLPGLLLLLLLLALILLIIYLARKIWGKKKDKDQNEFYSNNYPEIPPTPPHGYI